MSELENSKITLFTHEDVEDDDVIDEDDEFRIRHSHLYEQFDPDQKMFGVQITESNYDSNNYNYSESSHTQGGAPPGGSSSLGAILHQLGNGSFVGSNRGGATTQGRESVTTPFIYDENSLLNLSNTPSAMRTSKVVGRK